MCVGLGWFHRTTHPPKISKTISTWIGKEVCNYAKKIEQIKFDQKTSSLAFFLYLFGWLLFSEPTKLFFVEGLSLNTEEGTLATGVLVKMQETLAANFIPTMAIDPGEAYVYVYTYGIYIYTYIMGYTYIYVYTWDIYILYIYIYIRYIYRLYRIYICVYMRYIYMGYINMIVNTWYIYIYTYVWDIYIYLYIYTHGIYIYICMYGMCIYIYTYIHAVHWEHFRAQLLSIASHWVLAEPLQHPLPALIVSMSGGFCICGWPRVVS